jgi:hypothetical protein
MSTNQKNLWFDNLRVKIFIAFIAKLLSGEQNSKRIHFYLSH